MQVKVYIIRDAIAIEHIENNDISAFKAYLEEDSYLDFGEPENFDTEAEALAFCAGLGYGKDERGVVECFPLRSCEPADIPFIEAIEHIEI